MGHLVYYRSRDRSRRKGLIIWEMIQGGFIFIVGMEKEKQQQEWDFAQEQQDLDIGY